MGILSHAELPCLGQPKGRSPTGHTCYQAVAEKLALCPSCPNRGAWPTPLRDCCEVGEHVSGHHIQTCFCELQVEIFQVVISLSHRVLICRSQAGTRERCLDPAGGRDHGKVRALDRPNYLPLGTRDGGMHVLRGPSSERPHQCTWPLEPQLGNRVDMSPQRGSAGTHGTPRSTPGSRGLGGRRDRHPLTKAWES